MNPIRRRRVDESTLNRRQPDSARGCRLAFENLESKWLLAGEVVAENINGELRITGDDNNNGVVIRYNGAGGFTVQGVSRQGKTRVNGSTAVLTFSNVSWDLKVDLKGGSDLVHIRGPNRWAHWLSEHTDVVVFTGDGNDVVDIRNLSTNPLADDAYVSIDTGSGHDKVTISRVFSSDAFWVHTGSGNDAVTFNNVYTPIQKTLRVATGPDRDSVRFNRCVLGTLLVDVGSGIDSGCRFTNNQLGGSTIHELYGWDFDANANGYVIWRNNTKNAVYRPNPGFYWTDLA